MHEDTDFVWVCDDCGHQCNIQEITFSYAGTHCTYGLPGIHRTGQYESTCCGSDFHEVFHAELEPDM